MNIERCVIKALKSFTEKLERGEPVQIKRVRADGELSLGSLCVMPGYVDSPIDEVEWVLGLISRAVKLGEASVMVSDLSAEAKEDLVNRGYLFSMSGNLLVITWLPHGGS